MRARVIVLVIAAAVGIAVVATISALGSSGGPEGKERVEPEARPGQTADALPSRSVTAGEIDLSIEPVRIDAEGAVFRVAVNTHAVELDMDLAGSAALEVDGAPWGPARWTGDGPGGHHREGTLTFPAAGAARGTAVLTLDGFPGPVEASWDL